MKLDADLLAAAIGCQRSRAALFAGPLDVACARYAIDTPIRMAMFIAQIGHESGSLQFVREVWNPKQVPAQSRYEGRADLGNTLPGDGFRFRGRGLIQTTGRANYRFVRDSLRKGGYRCPDFEQEPELLEEPQWAALSACDYWEMRKCNEAADAGNFELVTRLVNGGTNGLVDRLNRWERAKRVLGVRETTNEQA